MLATFFSFSPSSPFGGESSEEGFTPSKSEGLDSTFLNCGFLMALNRAACAPGAPGEIPPLVFGGSAGFDSLDGGGVDFFNCDALIPSKSDALPVEGEDVDEGGGGGGGGGPAAGGGGGGVPDDDAGGGGGGAEDDSAEGEEDDDDDVGV